MRSCTMKMTFLGQVLGVMSASALTNGSFGNLLRLTHPKAGYCGVRNREGFGQRSGML